MATKEIDLLKKQIEKFDNKDFDLEAWKNYTIVLIGRIFGEDSQKIKQIRDIEYEHSSWSLRDTSGDSALDACKKLGREILEAAITELETFGVPGVSSQSSEEIIKIITEALQDELKGSQFKEIRPILNSSKSSQERKKEIFEKLKSYGSETANTIISAILANQKVGKKIK